MRKLWRVISLLFLLLVGCRREVAPVSEDYSLNLSIFLQGTSVVTKGDGDQEEGPVAATEAEHTIHSLQVWVFKHDDGALVAYFRPDPTEYNFQGGGTIRLQAAISESVAREAPAVDIFALVNGASVADGLNEETPRATLAGLTLSGNLFGPGVLCERVPDGGLPMAGRLLNVPMKGAFPVMKIESVVELTRLVSKIRFIFCQIEDEGGGSVGGYSITGIRLEGSVGNTEKVFTDKNVDIEGTASLAKNWNQSAELPQTLALNPSPGDYLYGAFTSAQDYDAALDMGVRRGVLTEWKRIYLRESGSAFSGEIKYTVNGGAEKTAAFSLPAGLFTRNHYWVVYSYFIGGKMVVTPTAVPWEAGHDYYNYDTQGQTLMGSGISYLRYDADGDESTWFDSEGNVDTWMCVSYSDPSTRPIYSTLNPIQLRTDNQNTLVLQTNNAHFLLQEVEYSESGTVTGYKTPVESIVLDPGKHDLGFYIVAASSSLGGHSAYGKIFLTAVPDPETNLPPWNIPFNHLLPGTEGHTAILVYDPLPTTFDKNKDNEYGNIPDGKDPHYWWVGTK